MEIKTREKYKFSRAVHDASVSCYPNVLYFDRCDPTQDDSQNGYTVSALPWHSCAFAPLNYNEHDGSDIKELFLLRLKSKGALIKNFPDKEEQIKDHFVLKDKDSTFLSSIEQWTGSLTADERNKIFNFVERAQGSMKSPLGLVPVVQHLFPVKHTEEVWICRDQEATENEHDYVVKPPEWTDERWQDWVAKNQDKYAGPYERPTTTLWTTIYTLSGLVLENKKHWYQNYGKLPASFIIPAMINGVPTGLADDLADDTLFNCVAEIEHLDEIRKGTGKLLVTREGAFTNIESLPEEASKTVGSLVIKKTAGPIDENIKEFTRTPNPIWKAYSNERKQDMTENTRINESMQGASFPRQSAIAKNTEIAQALITQAIYVDNINLCWENHQNLKLSMIPYLYDKYEVLRIMDEETNTEMTTEINAPGAIDINGDPLEIINDVTANRYKFKLSPTDDSPTSQQQQMAEAIVVLNAVAGPLMQADPSGRLFSNFLAAMPNNWLNKAGKKIAEDMKLASEAQSKAQQQESLAKAASAMAKAKADMEKARKSGTSISFTAEDFVRFPGLAAFYQELVQPDAQQMGAGQPPAQPMAPQAPMGPQSPQMQEQPTQIPQEAMV
jgi:hypothetical protein